MKKYLVINGLDAASRTFVANNNCSTYLVTNWYAIDQSSFIAETGLTPGGFPSSIVLMDAVSSLPSSWYSFNSFVDIPDLENQISQLQQARISQAASLPPAPPVPDATSFMGSIFQSKTLTPEAITQLMLTFPLISAHVSDAAMLQGAWAAMKASGYAWLTPQVVAEVEQYAKMFNVAII